MKKSAELMEKLKLLLADLNKEDMLFPCIEDLAVNGLTLSRFSKTERTPSRQDITQHIISWFYYIGAPEKACRQWVMNYCLNMLARLSTSSQSQIKHSVKSTLKYIYRSEVSLNCGIEHNPFKARCLKDCPAYQEMVERYHEKVKIDAIKASGVVEKQIPPENPEPPLTVKQQFKEQYDQSVAFIVQRLENGVSKRDILEQLTANEMVTRTGKAWNKGTLRQEIIRILEENPGTLKQREEEIPSKASDADEEKPVKVGKKEQFQEQFNMALSLAVNYVNEGISISEAVKLLLKAGYKTRSGRTWTSGILARELIALKAKTP